jgi:hypothetical protein
VRESGTFSWNTALGLHQLVCDTCRTAGHDDNKWTVLDPAYQQVEPDKVAGLGLELVAIPPAEPDTGTGRIELRLDGETVGDAALTLSPRTRRGHRRLGYGRVLALAALSRYDWSLEGPRWVRGDRRVRALAAVRGEGYRWMMSATPDTSAGRAFVETLPLTAADSGSYAQVGQSG